MAKADLGTKRACLACGMRFYDFSRSPIICPGCGAEFDPENIMKSRKGRPAAKSVARDDSDAADDDQIEDDDNAGELVASVVDDNDDDDIDFDDDDDVDVDDDGPGIIQDDISDDDELLPNLDDKDDS
ncbi:MAG TPA: TIGR02300 family protein [Alphaproteobacteria bacterium]|nr:TIGR02300 family protein [Alphaproteobacteria bacterium]